MLMIHIALIQSLEIKCLSILKMVTVNRLGKYNFVEKEFRNMGTRKKKDGWRMWRKRFELNYKNNTQEIG